MLADGAIVGPISESNAALVGNHSRVVLISYRLRYRREAELSRRSFVFEKSHSPLDFASLGKIPAHQVDKHAAVRERRAASLGQKQPPVGPLMSMPVRANV